MKFLITILVSLFLIVAAFEIGKFQVYNTHDKCIERYLNNHGKMMVEAQSLYNKKVIFASLSSGFA